MRAAEKYEGGFFLEVLTVCILTIRGHRPTWRCIGENGNWESGHQIKCRLSPLTDKFYVWKVARNCNGEQACLEAKLDADHATVCASKIAADAPVRVGFRQYAEPATRIGPADAELLYDRVIVFRPK